MISDFQISCVNCRDGKNYNCEHCNIYRLVQASQSMNRLELEDLIDCMESCNRENLPMNTLLDLKTNGRVAKVMVDETKINITKNTSDGEISW